MGRSTGAAGEGELEDVRGALEFLRARVAGSRDSYCPRRELQALAASLGGGECALIDQADHFFSGKLSPLGEAIAAWARVFRREAGEDDRGLRSPLRG